LWRRRDETPNRDLGRCRCAGCVLLGPLHRRILSNSICECMAAGLSDLSYCTGPPPRPNFLFCPRCECWYVCAGRYGGGNHLAALQNTSASLDFKLTHYRMSWTTASSCDDNGASHRNASRHKATRCSGRALNPRQLGIHPISVSRGYPSE
jgi:hypothetical protein